MLNGFHNLQKFKITSGIIHTASESTGTTTFAVCSKFETSSVFFAFPALLYSEIIETEEWELPETDENPERASLTAVACVNEWNHLVYLFETETEYVYFSWGASC